MKLHILISLFIVLISLFGGYGGSVVASSTSSESTLDDSTLRFISIQRVEDLISTTITPPINQDTLDTRYATISPDGKRIVTQRSNSNGMTLCTYLYETDAATCTRTNQRILSFLGGSWSPDNRYLVLYLDVHAIRNLYDTDIWIYDTHENRLINRTDDGVEGDFFSNAEIQARVFLDLSAVWSPNGDLYFFRNRIDPITTEWRTDLMRIPAEEILGTSDPEMILHHPASRPFGIYRLDSDWLDGTITISPDGQYLAYSAMSSVLDDEGNGIWIVDLAQKSAKVYLPYARFATATKGLPEWWGGYLEAMNPYTLAPRSLAWSADSNTLVTLLTNTGFGTPVFVPFIKYNLLTDTFQAIYDYSGLDTADNVIETRLFDDFGLIVDHAILAAITSPTQKAVFYLSNNPSGRNYVLSAMRIVEDGFTTPVRIHTLTDITPRGGFTSIGYDGAVVRIIVFGEVITLAP